MTNIDLISILGNISQLIFPIQRFIFGFAYILGIIFFYTAISKLKMIIEMRGRARFGGVFVPAAYALAAAALLYLPSAIVVTNDTVFGVNSLISYTSINVLDSTNMIIWLVRTAGIIWFIRGCVLLAHASNAGDKNGTKGMTFLVAGIFAINYTAIANFLEFIVDKLIILSGNFTT